MWKAFESSSSNVQQQKSHSRDGYHQKLYNEAFYNDMKVKYNLSLQSLLVQSQSTFDNPDCNLDNPLLSLSEISKSVKALLFQRVDDDSSSNAVTSMDDSYVKKWKQLLFITEKNIIKTHLAVLTSSSDIKSLSNVTTDKDSCTSMQLQQREETVRNLYVQAMDNFELMLSIIENQELDNSFGTDLSIGRSAEGFDLLMLQLVLSLSLKCRDYYTYQYLLLTYSSKFNRFYDKYLENQWKILAEIPKISSSFSSLNSSNMNPSSLSSVHLSSSSCNLLDGIQIKRIPYFTINIADSVSTTSVIENGIRFYSFLLQYFSELLLLPFSSPEKIEDLWSHFCCRHILESYEKKFGHVGTNEYNSEMEIVKDDKIEEEMEELNKDSAISVSATRRQTRNSIEMTSSLSNPDLSVAAITKTTDLKLRSSAVHDGDVTLFSKLEVIPFL
jgi:hypothetical protein